MDQVSKAAKTNGRRSGVGAATVWAFGRGMVVFGLVLALGVVVSAWCEYVVITTGKGRLYDDLEVVPARDVGLVLGTSRLALDGRPNAYFTARMDAAAALYHAGKVRKLILSGNGVDPDYNEPKDMKKALVGRRVPAEALVLDPEGTRTLTSVIRAQEIFGVRRFTVISQKFHNERALFLCDAFGLDAVGFNAEAVQRLPGNRTQLREVLARVRAVWDAYFRQLGAVAGRG
ncbi:MAG TPA: ElyC/SanA/YdcF family protein [Chthoniobacterales bacterium]